jgi:hypothetical protein
MVKWHRRGGENANTMAAVQDGAVWIQFFIDYHCLQGVRMIDFAYALEYATTVERPIWGTEMEAFQQWYARMSKQLGRQAPRRTGNELLILYRSHPDHTKGEAIELTIRYLKKRLLTIDYPHFRLREEYPVKAEQHQVKTREIESRVVTEADYQRMTQLADRIGKKKRQPWQNRFSLTD